jgi:hypothetical protein
MRVLDPACGSGNFLYVTLDLFKRLEGEVLAALVALGEKQELLAADAIRVTPAQFLGIEVKRWAKEIAELVLWIGYLQWHFRAYEKSMPVPEPVLRDYRNIECRDAVLAWDSEPELVRDEKGKPVTRWDGETMKKSPVTGEDVPDESARVPVYEYVNPRKGEWPKADFIVGNPPFLGARHIRAALGTGYLAALRAVYADVPENCDYVLYWWHRAATEVRQGATRRMGLITTNSITQPFSQRLVSSHLNGSEPFSVRFVVPDHPWVDEHDAADVRVAMTVCERSRSDGLRMELASEAVDAEGLASLTFNLRSGKIGPDFHVGVDVTAARALRANQGVCSVGYQLGGRGFVLEQNELARFEREVAQGLIAPLISARDIVQRTRGLWAVNVSHLNIEQIERDHPKIYQLLVDTVRPERQENARASYRERWWVYGEARMPFRPALAGIRRVVCTPITSKHRVFVFVPANTICDSGTVMMALQEGWQLAILSSRVHQVWALRAGGRMGVGNDPRYLKARCFDAFPFPAAHSSKLEAIEARLDEHRARALRDPDVYRHGHVQRPREAPLGRASHREGKGHPRSRSGLRSEEDPRRPRRRRFRCLRLVARPRRRPNP